MSEQALRVAILEYVRDLKSVDESSREITLSCLQETFGITLDSDESKSQSLASKGTNLLEVFSKGLGGDVAKPKAPVDSKRAEEFKLEGNQFIKAGDYKNAIASYTKAIEMNDTVAVYWLNRAIAKINTADHASALEDAQAAIVRDPKYTKAYYRKGQCLASLNRVQEAIAAFEEAEKRAADDPALLQSIRDQLRATRSLADTEKVLDSDPDMINKLAEGLKDNESVKSLAEDPEIVAIMQDVQQNGIGAALKHFQNPKVAAKLQPLMAQFMGGMGGGAGGLDLSGLAGMFGGGKM